jgi:hypothetical protein
VIVQNRGGHSGLERFAEVIVHSGPACRDRFRCGIKVPKRYPFAFVGVMEIAVDPDFIGGNRLPPIGRRSDASVLLGLPRSQISHTLVFPISSISRFLAEQVN